MKEETNMFEMPKLTVLPIEKAQFGVSEPEQGGGGIELPEEEW